MGEKRKELESLMFQIWGPMPCSFCTIRVEQAPAGRQRNVTMASWNSMCEPVQRAGLAAGFLRVLHASPTGHQWSPNNNVRLWRCANEPVAPARTCYFNAIATFRCRPAGEDSAPSWQSEQSVGPPIRRLRTTTRFYSPPPRPGG
jgi:hypothetical protein